MPPTAPVVRVDASPSGEATISVYSSEAGLEAAMSRFRANQFYIGADASEVTVLDASGEAENGAAPDADALRAALEAALAHATARVRAGECDDALREAMVRQLEQAHAAPSLGALLASIAGTTRRTVIWDGGDGDDGDNIWCHLFGHC